LRRLIIGILLVLTCSSAAHAKAFIREVGNIPAGGNEVTPMIGSGADETEIGAKFGWRIHDRGFVPMLNSSLTAEGAVFVCNLFGTKFMTMAPLLRWDFHVHPMWTVYASGGIELNVPLENDNYGNRDRMSTDVDVAIGSFWHVADHSDLRGEIDATHSSLRVGWTFKFD
jgi:hypothetical protein